MAQRSLLHLAAGEARGLVGYRIVCNRDESRDRAPAGVPKWRAIERQDHDAGRAIWPRDMQAGGTWIAAGQHGLSLCLLNLNLEPPPSLRGLKHLKSRGMVIPSLIGCGDASQAIERLGGLSLASFAPFRMIAVDMVDDRVRVAEARWDRSALDIAWHSANPICFVSSGLGDSKVIDRLRLFEDMVVKSEHEQNHQQDVFHRHTWMERPEVSVMMCRADARTVSVTTIEAGRDETGLWDVDMSYEPVPEADVVVEGSIRRAAAAR